MNALQPLPLTLPAPSPNHSPARLAECIGRYRARVASAELELQRARERNAAARKLICSGEKWCTQDAIWAHEDHVLAFEERLIWLRKSLNLHEVFFRQLHGRIAA